MNFLLKIVKGPNEGAEIALVDGVAVTIGKSDDCDVVLADPTMGDAPVKMEARPDGVYSDGERIEPFAVKTLGATSFAVGPADKPWGKLVWPVEEQEEKAKTPDDTGKNDEPAKETPREEPVPGKRRGCFGCLLWMIVLLAALAAAGWFFRANLRPWAEKARVAVSRFVAARRSQAPSVEPEVRPVVDLRTIAAKYGLSFAETNGVAKVYGNLRTRAERLKATAEMYAGHPGAELDISDDESFRTACEDALFTLTEGAVKVVSAKNRRLAVEGHIADAASLKMVVEAVSSDVPRLEAMDCSRVVLDPSARAVVRQDVAVAAAPEKAAKRANARKKALSLPVCGILTTPYPCIVTRSGTRILEGGDIGGSTVIGIAADSITVTNSTGRFVWKP